MSRPVGRVSRRTAVLAALFLATVVTAVLGTVPTGENAAPCAAREIASWAPEPRFTNAFARYGNDNSRLDDWTGGDGTHSVRLPGGRVLWLFSDTFLDRIQSPPNPKGQPHFWRRKADGGGPPGLLRNSLVVADPSGRPYRTLVRRTPDGPVGYFPDPSRAHGPAGAWRWPVAARVEPRTPGSSERVLRVLLWNRAPGTGPWLFGEPRSTEVATLSLPRLRLERVTTVADRTTVPDPGARVLYGTAAVPEGRYTYVYGGDAPTGRPAAQAYLARVPAGRLAEARAWRYWDGTGWRADAGRAVPVLRGEGRRGVGSAYTVVRDGGTWVLFTMDAAGGGGRGLATFTSYWSCTAHGPWHGPNGAVTPPRPPDPADSDERTAVYNPQAHPEFTGRPGLLLSYDVNTLGPPGTPAAGAVNDDVTLYRPRFLRIRMSGPE
ncbi:DUF4185 domain-containing protein [Streptomyces purpurogeneiscleroticus]|uniref:DUF4185 domain-containing protein n=1 Tax=Streptomyces purpurogeneiscleroticus TaxID=68259 RepID=UPI001CC0894C|nr:DUF4185 domain-containing protein [Streptomyces purpurogeneiscleroticus]MBZ4014879.1 hypothetical protein [Streptomyces purpurogeneiscleroticus]